MHTFQPVPTNLFDFNPFQTIGKEWMLITVETNDKINTMTASWGGFGVMWGKDVAYIVIRDSRYTKELIDQSETFSLSFLNSDYQSTLKYLGAVSGRDEDKITNARLHVNYHEEIPFIDEASTVMVCKKMCHQPLEKEQFSMDSIVTKWYPHDDYHTLYIGEIISLLAR
ncbi:MAG: flavin reductase family protein [Velocimicrobium sp.]